MGAIAEFAGDEIHVAAAQAYLKTLKSRGSALVVAPTWTEIEAVTERVRDSLKQTRVDQRTGASLPRL